MRASPMSNPTAHRFDDRSRVPRRSRRGHGLALSLALAVPILFQPWAAWAAWELDRKSEVFQPSSDLLARGGGGGGRGGGGGGGARGGGGGSFGGGGGRSGFQNTGGAGGLNRGSSRPSGGWSQSVQGNSPSPGLSRPAQRPAGGMGGAGGGDRFNQGGGFAQNRTPGGSLSNRTPGNTVSNRNPGDRTGNRTINSNLDRNVDRNVNRNVNRNVDRNLNRTVNRNVSGNVGANWNRDVNINNVNLSPGWARPGWGYARPWSYGWYGGWATPAWGWWGASAALWGVTSLATAAAINAAVDASVADNTTYIVVPQTSYQLLYGTVQPSAGQSVTFLVQVDGTTYNLSADCNAGTIDGQSPNSAAQAELLNAACQVAFGST